MDPGIMPSSGYGDTVGNNPPPRRLAPSARGPAAALLQRTPPTVERLFGAVSPQFAAGYPAVWQAALRWAAEQRWP